ncbi:Carbohydrate esterase 4 protein [Tulasnella sp. 418]|nr:Carbohydrate esterase 4 protein [Tulasnella sp. 418]
MGTGVLAVPTSGNKPPALANVYTSCVKPKTVALTFDDGPYIYTKEISDTLLKNGAKGTFFVNGNTWTGKCIYEDNGARVKYLYQRGHQIASHLWNHTHAPELTAVELTENMVKVEKAIQRITGAVTAFIRPPYGEYNDLFRELAHKRKQSLVNWDFDARDWDTANVTPEQTKAWYKEVLDKNPKNLLPLNHEVYESTAKDVLPYVIGLLKAKGYRMVTVAECLGLPPYLKVGKPKHPDSSWVC